MAETISSEEEIIKPFKAGAVGLNKLILATIILALFIDEHRVAEDRADVLVLIEEGGLFSQFVRQENIVRAQHRDVLSAGLLETIVGGDTCAAVLRETEQPNSRVFELLNDVHGSVGGAIIGDDDFEVRSALVQHALDSLTHKPFVIVRRDDHRNPRRGA